jgi:hypothetical protein
MRLSGYGQQAIGQEEGAARFRSENAEMPSRSRNSKTSSGNVPKCSGTGHGFSNDRVKPLPRYQWRSIRYVWHRSITSSASSSTLTAISARPLRSAASLARSSRCRPRGRGSGTSFEEHKSASRVVNCVMSDRHRSRRCKGTHASIKFLRSPTVCVKLTLAASLKIASVLPAVPAERRTWYRRPTGSESWSQACFHRPRTRAGQHRPSWTDPPAGSLGASHRAWFWKTK